MKMGKSYLTFTMPLYRILIWGLYPLCALLGCYFVQFDPFGVLGNQMHFMVTASLLGACIISAEIISDYFIFGGAYCKLANKMDFLKTSENGKRMYFNALVMDSVRKWLLVLTVNVVNVLMGYLGLGSWCMESEIYSVVCSSLLTILVSAIGTIIARFAARSTINFVLGTTMNFTFTLFMMVCASIDTRLKNVLAVVVLAVLSIAVTVFGIWFALKKWEETYYD